MYKTVDELRQCQLDELLERTNSERFEEGLDDLDMEGLKEFHRRIGTNFTNDDFFCTGGQSDEELDLEDAKNGDFRRFEEGKCKLPFCNQEDANEETRYWSIDEILEEINRDHSSNWTPYDKTDWYEGMKEWTEYGLAI